MDLEKYGEKQLPSPTISSSPGSTSLVDLDTAGERNGYVLDASKLDDSQVYKLASDGHTVLIPQPSDDPNDPLNWSTTKKHVILFIISACSFLPDYSSATGAVTLIPQAAEWGLTPDIVNHSQSGGQFMVGAGGVVVVALSAYFGRLPVLFWFLVVSLASAAACASVDTFDSFMAVRILNGFFSTVAQGVRLVPDGGLMFIKDMFFFHEHARKINIWQSIVIASPYFGPLFAAFMLTKLNWRWPFGIVTIATGLCTLLVVFFVDETYYNRKLSVLQQPVRTSRWLRLIGVEQWRSRYLRNTPYQAFIRPFKALSKPIVLLTNIYYIMTFAWVVGINATLAIFITPLYDFGPRQIGFFYFAPIVAAILGEIVGHYLHDTVARLYLRRHGGRLEPEARLYVIPLATPFMLAGLVLIGFCLQNGYHYMITAFAWGMFIFGIMITTVGVSAYNLDSYPEGSGEVAAWINFSRTTGGFVVSYLQVRWADAMGPQRSFGIQAGICAGAFAIVVVLMVFGKRLRVWSGPLDFKTS
ncbi:hypothetical protein MMC27_002046 [Xylographa pallens]|nr:hypothetical protein [Xylographa pallens]